MVSSLEAAGRDGRLVMFRTIAAALALILASSSSPGAAAAETGTKAELPSNAMDLSLVLNPKDAMLDLSERAFDAGFTSGAKSDAKAAALFSDNPGLMDKILTATHPVVRKHMAKTIPSMQRRFAIFYGQRFTSSEIDELLGFYRSRAGAKLVAGMYAGADMDSLVGSLGSDGKGVVTAEDMRSFNHSTTKRILPVFTDADRKAILDFMDQAAFAKLTKVLPDFQKLLADVANEPPSAAMEADIESTVERAMEEYFAGKATNKVG
jgi:hypothetical protein